MIPNFICPGAQKSATTTLYNILTQHPDVFVPSCKETHFFDVDDKYKKGKEWYESTYYSNTNTYTAVGDISPRYMFYSNVPKRILRTIGRRVKFIFLLRDPIKRAHSQYWMHRGNGSEELSFRQAVKNEIARRNNEPKKRLRKLEQDSRIRGYVGRGLYAKQIKRYLSCFDKKSMMFILFEEFTSNLEKTTKSILEFLEVRKDINLTRDIRKNEASTTRYQAIKKAMRNDYLKAAARLICPDDRLRRKISKTIKSLNSRKMKKPEIDEDIKRKLCQFYKKDVRELENIISRDLKHWLNK